MTFGARFGTLAILAGLVLGASPGLAQTDTPGGKPDATAQTETPGSWTDPPVRGAAGPKPADAAKPTENAAAPEKAAPDRVKPIENASRPEKDGPAADRQRSASAARPAHRSAKLKRERIRVAARSKVLAEAPSRRLREDRVARARDTVSPPHAAQHRFAERRVYAYRAYRPEPPRYARRYAMREEAPYREGGTLPGYGARRAGWGGLIEDSRESWIAQARAAGYIVMRSRSYLYPDGMRVREMSPYAGYGPE